MTSNLNIQPLFSILIANYNNGNYLDACLYSIFVQTYKNWEIIIVDDASTDNSISIYEKYIGNDRVKIFRNEKNSGCGFSKRKCVEHANGAICGFVDADDALFPTALEILVKQHLDSPECSIVYSNHYICDEGLNPQKNADYVGQIPPNQKSVTLLLPTISHFATFKMTKYRLTKGISDFFPKAVDKDLYYKLEETGPVLFVNQPLYFYRHHSSSISLNDQAIVAYQYELAAKVLALLRLKNSGSLPSIVHHSKRQLTEGMIRVVYYEIKKMHLIASIKFLLGLISFFLTSSIKFFL